MNIEIEPLESRLAYLKEASEHLKTCDKHKHENATVEVVEAELKFWEMVSLFPNFKEAYERKFQTQLDACERSQQETTKEQREQQWRDWLSHEGPVPWSDASSGSSPSSSSSS